MSVSAMIQTLTLGEAHANVKVLTGGSQRATLRVLAGHATEGRPMLYVRRVAVACVEAVAILVKGYVPVPVPAEREVDALMASYLVYLELAAKRKK